VKQRMSSLFDLHQPSAKAPTHQRRRTALVPFFADGSRHPCGGVTKMLNSHQRRKAASRASLHREETERLAFVRHPRRLP
jgi:hypothetical protein